MVASTAAAGTISHTARGVSSFFTRSAIDEAPTAFARVSSSTAFGDRSKTTHWWPPARSRRHHVGAHATESDHSELHHGLLCRAACSASSVSSFAWSMAARRRFIAPATPSRSPKIDEPATSTVAPARTTRGAVVASMPPSTSTSQPGLRRSIELAYPLDLRQGRPNELLMAEARVDGHDQHLLQVLDDLLEHRSWRRRVDSDRGALAESPDALHRAVQIVVAFPVDEERIGAGRGELVQEEVRVRDHQMRLERQTRHPAQGLDDRRSHGEIRARSARPSRPRGSGRLHPAPPPPPADPGARNQPRESTGRASRPSRAHVFDASKML